ncbi:MAG: hypothetical protein ACK48R_21040 [Planctomyces sp.]
MNRPIQLLAGLLLLSSGCSHTPASAAGGTAGKLLIGSETTREIMVHIGRRSGNTITEPGFGTTDDAGEFQLLLPDAHGPLQLTCADPTRLPDLQIETADGNP